MSKEGGNTYSKVQADRQWVRRVKQEEIHLMQNTDEEDEMMERERLLQMYKRKNAANMITSKAKEESKVPDVKPKSQISQSSRISSKAPSIAAS